MGPALIRSERPLHSRRCARKVPFAANREICSHPRLPAAIPEDVGVSVTDRQVGYRDQFPVCSGLQTQVHVVTMEPLFEPRVAAQILDRPRRQADQGTVDRADPGEHAAWILDQDAICQFNARPPWLDSGRQPGAPTSSKSANDRKTRIGKALL